MNEERETAVLAAIDAHWRKNYTPPTIRQICQAVGIDSTSLVRGYVDSLATDRMVIYHGRGKPVPIWVRDAIDEMAYRKRQADRSTRSPQESLDVLKVGRESWLEKN